METERNKLLNQSESLKLESVNLQSKIRTREDSLEYHQKQLEESNKAVCRLNNQVKELELQNEKLNEQLIEMDGVNQKEIKLRLDNERLFEELEMRSKDQDKSVKTYKEQLAALLGDKDKLYEDNTKMFNEIERLKNHVLLITEQNQRVILIIQKNFLFNIF